VWVSRRQVLRAIYFPRETNEGSQGGGCCTGFEPLEKLGAGENRGFWVVVYDGVEEGGEVVRAGVESTAAVECVRIC
jgi:hypothetical protein